MLVARPDHMPIAKIIVQREDVSSYRKVRLYSGIRNLALYVCENR